MNAFELLRTEIKNYVWEQGWPSLWPIQEAAITYACTTSDNLILAAPTASGKTEAAFLPAISKMEDWQTGVKIVYISPLIALINDQFKRVTDLCDYLDIPVTSWHGESSQSKKKKLIKTPRGILLITPESIEGLLSRRPAQASQLFAEVEYIIIDELHSFLDSARGAHLQSLLQRINTLSNNQIRHIGLSATLSRDSYDLAKTFFGKNQKTTVLVDNTQNELTVSLLHEKNETPSIPVTIIDNIYKRSQSERMLVFPNTRGKVEEIAVRLQRRAHDNNSLVQYFSHHSSVDKELRLEAEHFAKTARSELFTICCTSTLELGIDIGAVDSICQVDAVSSVSSLAQRLGRSGRQEHHSKLHLYTTNAWSLLQTIACTELFKSGQLEQIRPILKPFEVLFQQILSLLLQFNSLTRAQLLSLLATMSCWQKITSKEIELLVDDMISKGFIEEVERELIVGLAAERIVESRSFYAHFESKSEYRVLNGTQHIGDMPRLPSLIAGVNIFLAAKIWKIGSVDDDTRKIFVFPAHDGKPPVYGGGGGEVSHIIRQTMRLVVTNLENLPGYCEESIEPVLRGLSQSIGVRNIKDNQLPIQKKAGNKEVLTTFAGTKINKTLLLLLNMHPGSETIELDEYTTSFSGIGLNKLLITIQQKQFDEKIIEKWLFENPEYLQTLLTNGKYSKFLPLSLQIQSVLYNMLDLSGTNQFLKQ